GSDSSDSFETNGLRGPTARDGEPTIRTNWRSCGPRAQKASHGVSSCTHTAHGPHAYGINSGGTRGLHDVPFAPATHALIDASTSSQPVTRALTWPSTSVTSPCSSAPHLSRTRRRITVRSCLSPISSSVSQAILEQSHTAVRRASN